MEQPLCRTDNGTEYAENCRNENIRFFTVPRRTQRDKAYPNWHFYYSDNEDTPWQICDTESAQYFSAIGFHFARKIKKETGVAVGIISCNWGGTQIEPYIEESLCRKTPSIQPVVKIHDNSLAGVNDEEYVKTYEKHMERRTYYNKNIRGDSICDVKKLGLRAAELYPWGDSENCAEPYGRFNSTVPGILYEAMVSRIMPFSLKGVLWYQGESNANRMNLKHNCHRDGYDEKYAVLMQCWREGFKCPELPFYAVELAPYKTAWDDSRDEENYTWAYMRELQMNAARLENSYIVSAQSNDDGFSIHPTNKKVVADRLASSVLKNTYKRNNFSESPSYKSVEFADGRAYVTFENGEGLFCSYANPYIFVCGQDRIFHRAHCYAENDRLVVWSKEVKEPCAVRYCYSDYFVGTVFNGDGMPLHPFRTDDFELFEY